MEKYFEIRNKFNSDLEKPHFLVATHEFDEAGEPINWKRFPNSSIYYSDFKSSCNAMNNVTSEMKEEFIQKGELSEKFLNYIPNCKLFNQVCVSINNLDKNCKNDKTYQLQRDELIKIMKSFKNDLN